MPPRTKAMASKRTSRPQQALSDSSATDDEEYQPTPTPPSYRPSSATPGSSSSRHGRTPSSRPPTYVSPPNEFGIIFRNAAQEARYQILRQRRVLNTRYLDRTALQMLGLLGDFDLMYASIGWEQFEQLLSPTYVGVTLEFLSSLEVKAEPALENDPGRLSFRLGNIDHSLSLSQFRGIYGFPEPSARRVPTEYSEQNFWGDITNEHIYSARTARASSLCNPVIKYVHRVLAHTLFGRGESDGMVRQTELFYIWCMLHSFRVDSGYYLAKHFSRVARSLR